MENEKLTDRFGFGFSHIIDLIFHPNKNEFLAPPGTQEVAIHQSLHQYVCLVFKEG